MRAILISAIVIVSGCGGDPVGPAAEPAEVVAINLSGLPGAKAIWIDGEILVPALEHTQPSLTQAIAPGSHSFGYSAAGASKPEVTADLVIPGVGFSIVALLPGSTGPEIRVVTYPPPRSGTITVRMLNTSGEPAQVVIQGSSNVPGGVRATIQAGPGEIAQGDVPGQSVVTTPVGNSVTRTVVSIRTGPTDGSVSNLIDPIGLGFAVSGEVRTVVFHRDPRFVPDVYTF